HWRCMMSRVERALRKIQARTATHLTQSAMGEAARPLANLTELPADAKGQYGGKLVQLDWAELKAQGLLAPDHEQRRLAEEYRVIKRPLLNNADPRSDLPLANGNLIMVTSALAGEGKTFTCL